MVAEDLMRKYKYGYVHSCEMLEEPFTKDLLKENQELKKQLEERTKMYLNAYKYSQGMENEVITLNTQQKEFIKYLEDEIEELQKIKETELDYDILKDVIPQLLVYKDVLQKYKSIIGVSDERKS